jgi:serine/threonine protein kinase
MDRDPFDLVGDVLDGQFRVESFAGEGDLSVVYKGHHIGVDAPVAIKCLNLPATLDPALARPLVEGFKEASRLHYRLARGNLNIAQSIASGSTLAPRTGTVVPYLVREWFEGESLASELARRRQEGRAGRTIDEAFALLASAFDGLAFAHGEGHVHLSINPSNLFLAKRGNSISLKVLDFGVARAMNDLVSGLPQAARAGDGLRLLFPAYAAPEQFDWGAGDLGAWTDVYALALVAMEVLSDRIVMFEQETGAVVARALDPRRRPTPESHGLKLQRELDMALARAVERAPERRQKNAAELWHDIKNASRTETLRPTFSRSFSSPPQVMQPPPAALLQPPPQRPRARTLVGVGHAPPPMVAGAVGPRLRVPSTPSVETRPLSFDPRLPLPSPDGSSDGQGAAEGVAAAVTAAPNGPLTTGSPTPAEPPVAAPPPERGPFAENPPVQHRGPPTLVFAAAGGALIWLILLVAAGAPLIALSGRSDEPASASSGHAVPAPPPPATSAAPEPVAGSAPEPPSAPAPSGHFSVSAARRALDVTARDVSKCRRNKKWGVAFATVTFAGDGSVDHVAVGSPLTGTETGTCVADALGAARIEPFGDRPAGVIVYRFYVPPR